jgi:aryl-alcohol dehydrogenase-like predicted oxidoreductase
MSGVALGGRFGFPGTSSVAHPRENLDAGRLSLSTEILAGLEGIAASGQTDD